MRTLLVVLFSFTMMLQAQILYDFSSTTQLDSWKVVNDGVMGGRSKGAIERTNEGYGRFSGTVSLENYGGFTSVRCTLPTTQVGPDAVAVLRIKGDGKSYQFRVKHKSSDYYTYVQTFETSGEWETIELPLADMVPQWRGRRVDLPQFDRSEIEEMTLLIANKKNESFELLVERISLR